MAELVDSYVKLLLHFDGVDGAQADIDYSGFNHVLTFNNQAQLDTGQKVFGPTSLRLDGSGDYISIPDSADWYYATDDVTIDFRVRFNADPNHVGFLSQRFNDSNLVQMYIQNGNTLVLHSSESGTKVSVSGPWNPTTGTWYHLAYVRSGNTHFLFVNGTDIANSGQTDADEIPNIAANLDIGRFFGFGSFQYVNGWIDEFRISKGIARWTSNFTPPPYAYQKIARIVNL